MADPQFLEIQRIHTEVLSVLRKNNAPEKTIAAVSAKFGTHRPTLRARTNTALRPMVRSIRSLYTTKLPYRPGCAYISVFGDDGVDDGLPMWVVITPTPTAAKVRTEIRKLVKEFGLRALKKHLNDVEVHLYPKPVAQIAREAALKQPGLYLQDKWVCGKGFEDVPFYLAIVHPQD